MLAFLNLNNCFDGPLAYIFRVAYPKVLYSQKLQQAALACLVLAYSIQLIGFLFFTDFYYIWTGQSTLKDLTVVSDTQK